VGTVPFTSNLKLFPENYLMPFWMRLRILGLIIRLDAQDDSTFVVKIYVKNCIPAGIDKKLPNID
jgi:hypothetical protein